MGIRYILYSCVAGGVGLAMLITGLLPADMIRSIVGDKFISSRTRGCNFWLPAVSFYSSASLCCA